MRRRPPSARATLRRCHRRPPALPMTPVDAWAFDRESARRTLLDQLRAGGLEGFGLERHPAAVAAAGALVHYLRATQKVDLAHVRAIAYRQRADALLIDPTTLKHLEILEGSEGGRDGSLLDELDRTVTSMGSRLLRAWLLRPLVALERDPRSARRRRGAGVPHDRSRQVPRRDQGGPGSRAPGRARGARHGRAARSRRPQAVARRRPARPHACSRELQAPLVRSLVAELDDLADVRDRDRGDAHRRAAGAGARRRLHPRRRRPRARRAARRSAGRASRSSPRWKSASARAPASPR